MHHQEVHAAIEQEQGFSLFVLRNDRIEIAAVPELGSKVVSLKNRRTGRQWMWRPSGGRRLFRNRPGDDFAISTLVGWDECLPTIAPCDWQSRTLPDHGEAWSMAWEVEPAAWQNGVLKASVRLPISPFTFQRTMELRDNEIRLDYELRSSSAEEEQYLWAIHPLLAICEGDRLVPTAEASRQLADETWIHSLDFGSRESACAKVFAGPLREGRVGVQNSRTGDQLTLQWDAAENDTLGVWLTRGGWHGHHHLALEPTNGSPDSLAEAAGQGRCGRIAPGGVKSWSMRLQIEP